MTAADSKKKAKGYLGILAIGIALLVILGIVFYSFTNRKPPVSYTTLRVNRLPTAYVLGSTLRMRNTVDISKQDQSLENWYYIAPKIDVTGLRTGAQKLGLSNEFYDEVEKQYFWYRDDDADADSITFDVERGLLQLTFPDGMGSATVIPDDALTYIANFFGLSTMGATPLKKLENGDRVTVNFSLKYNDKTVYFDQARESLGSVNLRDGKIINALFYALPATETIQSAGQLKPLSELSLETVSRSYFTLDIKPDSVAEGVAGTVVVPPQSIDTNFTEYTHAYYFYIDTKGEIYFIPVIDITGRYIDNQNKAGTVKMLVVNQSSFF